MVVTADVAIRAGGVWLLTLAPMFMTVVAFYYFSKST